VPVPIAFPAPWALPLECEELYLSVMPKNFRPKTVEDRRRNQQTHEENWLKRNGYWFWGTLSAFIPLATWLFGVLNLVIDGRVAEKLKEPNRQLAELSSKIDIANGRLQAMQSLWEEQLKKSAELNPSEFQKALPQTAEALKAASTLKIRIPSDLSNSIQEKLGSASERAPEYWSAVAQFVSYRSSFELARFSESLSLCDLQEEREIPGVIPEEPYQSFTTWMNCTLDLDTARRPLRILLNPWSSATALYDIAVVRFRCPSQMFDFKTAFLWFSCRHPLHHAGKSCSKRCYRPVRPASKYLTSVETHITRKHRHHPGASSKSIILP
jgi:hypothetical protein